MLYEQDIKFDDWAVDRWAENVCVAVETDTDQGSRNLLTVKGLISKFSHYGDSDFSGFYYFCKDIFAWRRPNTSLAKFNFDPLTGAKIDWERVYDYGKTFLYGYSEKAEKELSKKK